MNWFKKLIAPSEWITIYSAKCQLSTSSFGVYTGKTHGWVFVKYDLVNHKYKSYATDGDSTVNAPLEVLVMEFPDLKPILKQYNINY